jgi:hypothetical protein
MNAALARDPDAIRVNLTLPTTTIRLGPLAFDGLQALLGASLAEVLSPLLIGQVTQRSVEGGGVVDVYPLAIPEGEGASIPIKWMGEIGFRNYRGFLVLIVPPAVAEVVRVQLAGEIAKKEAVGPRFVQGIGGGIVAEFAVRLRPGMRKAVPVGAWGEIGVEAV